MLHAGIIKVSSSSCLIIVWLAFSKLKNGEWIMKCFKETEMEKNKEAKFGVNFLFS